MSRVVNALVIGAAAFVLGGGLLWLLFVEPEPTARIQEVPPPTDTTTKSPTSTTTTTTTTQTTPTTTTTTTTTTPPPTTTSLSPLPTPTTNPTTTTTEPPNPVPTSPTPTTTTTTTLPPPTTTTPPPTTTTNNSSAAAYSPAPPLRPQGARHVLAAGPPPFALVEGWESGFGELALLLVAGGIILLGLVVVLLMLTSFLPFRPVKHEAQPLPSAVQLATPTLTRELEPSDAFLSPEPLARGRRAAKEPRPNTLDEALDWFSTQYGGHPRLMRLLDHQIVLRVYECPDCALDADGREGCGFTAGFLEAAVARTTKKGARVRETACRRLRSPVCEFEVAI